ncbi:MAG: hypothetical protein JO212_10505, partial [Acetobacteraceae bacterium]|nr:hypothetical protein [Acetobacteraceae bacterium]
MFGFDAGCHAREAIRISRFGKTYSGPSSPWWYSARDLYRLMQQVMPPETTVARLCRDLGFDIHDNRIARQLRRCDAEALLQRLRENNPPVPPERLGMLGPSASGERHYAIKSSTTGLHDGAKIPYVTEAWAECTRSENRGHGTARLQLLLNRTPSLAAVVVNSRSKELILQGCNLYRLVQGPGTGHYNITLSIIAPYIQLANDGKEPCLAPFSEAIAEVLRKACSAAHRAMEKPARKCTIKDAAWQVMAKAYSAASGDGRYPANARQIMYAARPDILKLTGATKLDDRYFTQTLLPDYIEAHPSETRDWDVVFDARGNFIEPHTSREVPLGTIEVRQYLGDRPYFERSIALNSSTLSPTSGPEHRYSAVLLIEKEGFGPLLQRARTAERFDLAIMSTKGMSTVAARMLADRLAARIDKVLVLHDLDVSGFSIFGTLAADGRRYRFKHNVRIVDLGLRLA